MNNVSFDPVNHWGYASLDWSVGRATWLNPDRNKSTCEATSTANCAELKASGKVVRCGIYHNVELALQWLESNRAVMYDSSKADWFLQFTDGQGHKNGTIYNQPREEGDQYFIDWRNPDAAAYFVAAIVNTTLQAGVDATFTDDRDGVPIEHPNLPALLNMSNAEIAQVQFATQASGQYLATALAANSRTCWDCFSGENLLTPPSQATCAQVMRELCMPGVQGSQMFLRTGGNWQSVNQTVAAFLIVRPPIAFLGDRVQDSSWNPIFALDVGEPLNGALCTEDPPGVFSRQWTKGRPTLDCNTWQADLPFSILPGVQVPVQK